MIFLFFSRSNPVKNGIKLQFSSLNVEIHSSKIPDATSKQQHRYGCHPDMISPDFRLSCYNFSRRKQGIKTKHQLRIIHIDDHPLIHTKYQNKNKKWFYHLFQVSSLKFYVIKGIIFVLITGTISHFVYDWSGNNFILES